MLINKSKKKYNIAFQIISFLCLIGSFVYLILFIDKKIDCYIDADLSGELILGKILSKGNNIFLTKEYLYTTEIRFLHENQIYALVFKFCNNWHNVRVISSAIMWLLAILSYYFLCCQVEIKRYFAISAAVLIMPLSMYYADWVLFPLYYCSHIITLFITMGLVIKISKTEKGKEQYILLGLIFLFSFVISLNGMRELVMLNIPLAISSFVVEKIYKCNKSIKKSILGSYVALAGSVIGFMINAKILVPIYGCLDAEMYFSDINFKSFLDVINDYFILLGYSKGAVFSIVLIKNALCIFLVIAICVSVYFAFKKVNINNIKFEDIELSAFLVCAMIIYQSISLFTYNVHGIDARYCIPYFMIWLPLVVVGLERSNYATILKDIIILMVVSVVVICSENNYAQFKYLDKTKDLRNIAHYLENTEYEEGYMDVNCALTEFSNGKLKVYGWPEGNFDNMSTVDERAMMGQLSSVVGSDPKGKIFVVIRKEDYDIWSFKNKVSKEYLIYETDNYWVFGFESCEYFKNLIKQE